MSSYSIRPRLKPSHILKAYQNISRKPLVQHRNISNHVIWLKNKHYEILSQAKGLVQQICRKTLQDPYRIGKKQILMYRRNHDCFHQMVAETTFLELFQIGNAEKFGYFGCLLILHDFKYSRYVFVNEFLLIFFV